MHAFILLNVVGHLLGYRIVMTEEVTKEFFHNVGFRSVACRNFFLNVTALELMGIQLLAFSIL